MNLEEDIRPTRGIESSANKVQQAERLRSPLRWAGSKKRQLPRLLSLIQSVPIKTIEPFAGSACFTMRAGAKDAVISDLNADLIAFYEDLCVNTSGLFDQFSSFSINSDTYYQCRASFNSMPRSLSKSAIFLYLNRYGFNGIYRVNKSGGYNVPWGGEKSGTPPNLEELQQVAKYLSKHVKILTGDFEDVVRSELIPGALVYLDPPYARDEVRVFREYQADSFTTRDWGRLIELVDHINSIGAYFILSYAGDAELVGSLAQWEVGKLEVTRNVGGFASSRRKHSEFMASNIEQQYEHC